MLLTTVGHQRRRPAQHRGLTEDLARIGKRVEDRQAVPQFLSQSPFRVFVGLGLDDALLDVVEEPGGEGRRTRG